MKQSGRPVLTETEVDERKTAVLNAALQEIAERGLDSVRIKDVAVAAGCSTGQVQYYFDSRDSLLLAAIRMHSDQVVERIALAYSEHDSPRRSLQRLVESYLYTDSLVFRGALWLELTAASFREEKFRDSARHVYESWLRVVTRVIRRGVEEGDFMPEMSVEEASEAVLALVDGFEVALLSSGRYSDPKKLEPLINRSIRALLGVRT